MNITPKRALFRRRNESNVYRMFFWVTLILGGIWLIRSVQRGDIKPLFEPTPVPTRMSISLSLEGDAQFTAGQLEDTETSTGAITAYLQAVELDPNNAQLLAKLARIQTYSSAMIVDHDAKTVRLAEALDSAKRAVELAPDDSNTHAIYAFTLDWNATNFTNLDDVNKMLSQAEQEAARAAQLDSSNVLARAFYAEILLDQGKWTLAQTNIEEALKLDSSQMDVHRVNAAVLEAGGDYAAAIEAYVYAIKITPNLTFLYQRAGANYRRLALESLNEDVQNQLYEKSLEYFSQAASINAQLKVNDPAPYLSIAKTYSQMGQFFIAIRNVQKTIEFQPSEPLFYGELGVLYHKNRNYETGILALKCAVRGCTAEESCPARGDCGDKDVPAEVKGLPLRSDTIYYYDIYASELAALNTPRLNYCSEALSVAAEIQASEFVSDPNIAADLVVVRSLCNSNADTPTPAITPTVTP
ncbi:MAG: tetratricopeptide repeat protein [Chloroflexi bacterium]|nr:tetratricopeptide repeat protein [Chloroflexota bacterium]